VALRPVSALGLTDPTDIDPRGGAAVSESQRRQRPNSRKPAAGKRTELRAKAAPVSPAAVIDRPTVPLADEAAIFVQIMVPGELHERLADVSHLLAAEHRKLRHHKTILGALIWRYVEPGSPELLRELGAALDEYLADAIAEAPAEIKVGATLPFSLKYRLDGAALALRRTRRLASAKTVLSALLWRHARTAELDALVELLSAYRVASAPTPTALP
jgi:hypothetical protein